MKSLSIQELVAARIEAKRAEDAAIQARRELDEQLALLMNTGKTEGTESQKLPELGVKVSVTYGVTRKVDTDKLQADWAKLPAATQAAFKWKADVSVAALRQLDGGDATAAATYITSKPAAPSVKVELI